MGTFTSGVALLLNFWGAKRCGLSTDFQKEMTDIRKCIDFLGANEKRYALSTPRFLHIITYHRVL